MAGPTTTGNGQIVKRDKDDDPETKLRKAVKKMTPQIEMAVPKHIMPARFIRQAMTAITATPKLAECDQGSFFACLLTAAQLGLEPNTPLGHGWLIPRWNNKLYGRGRGGLECTWQTGYQGYIVLAYRSGMVTSIRATAVREGDFFEWDEGTDPKIVHRPMSDDRPITHVYGVVKIRNADPHFEVLTFAKIERHRMMNEAEKKQYFSPWRDHWEAMARKTAISMTLKYAPKSAEFQQVESMESASAGYSALSSAVDKDVIDAIASQGIVFDAPAEPEPEPTPPAPMTWAAEKKEEPEPEKPEEPSATSEEQPVTTGDPRTDGLTADQIAKGYEFDDHGEFIPPPKKSKPKAKK